MGSTLLRFDPTICPDPLAWKAAAIISCLHGEHADNPVTRSIELGEIHQKPVIVIYHDEMPHPPDDNLSTQEKDENTQALAGIIHQAYPHQEDFFAANFNLSLIANNNHATCFQPNCNRLANPDGTFSVEAGIITLWSKSLTLKEIYSIFSALPADKIEFIPDGNHIRLVAALHEAGHIEELRETIYLNNVSDEWLAEIGADNFAAKGFSLKAILEPDGRDKFLQTLDAFIKSRILAAYLAIDPPNWHTLMREKGSSVDFETEATDIYELRLMTLAYQLKVKLPRLFRDLSQLTSAERRQLISDFHTDKVISAIRGIILNSDNSQLNSNQLGTIRGHLYKWCENPLAQAIRSIANDGGTDAKDKIWELTQMWADTRMQRGLSPQTFSLMERIFFGPKYYWKHHSDTDKSIPTLDALLEGGYLTDELSQLAAKRIIESALYFRPSLETKFGLTYKSEVDAPIPANFGHLYLMSLGQPVI